MKKDDFYGLFSRLKTVECYVDTINKSLRILREKKLDDCYVITGSDLTANIDRCNHISDSLDELYEELKELSKNELKRTDEGIQR